MASHSSILAWEIPWAKEPSSLQSTGLQRVRRDWTHPDANPVSGISTAALPSWAAVRMDSLLLSFHGQRFCVFGTRMRPLYPFCQLVFCLEILIHLHLK